METHTLNIPKAVWDRLLITSKAIGLTPGQYLTTAVDDLDQLVRIRNEARAPRKSSSLTPTHRNQQEQLDGLRYRAAMLQRQMSVYFPERRERRLPPGHAVRGVYDAQRALRRILRTIDDTYRDRGTIAAIAFIPELNAVYSAARDACVRVGIADKLRLSSD